MDGDVVLSDVKCLSDGQRDALERGRYVSVADLLHTPPHELAARTGLSYADAARLVADVVSELAPAPTPLAVLAAQRPAPLSTGDRVLDAVLSGGIRPGLLWEFSGESGSGKTQLALQLALMTQLPTELGGLAGSCCFLPLWGFLPTPRLQQLLELHPLLSSSACSLDHIHALRPENMSALLEVLSVRLPILIRSLESSLPLRLLVLDNFTNIFRSDDTERTTTDSLVDRSRDISEVSSLLHGIATAHGIAVIVINEVSDVFAVDESFPAPPSQENPTYRATAPWFSTAANVPGENAYEPALGLAWANQVNVRVLFSKTGRRRAPSSMPMSKRQKVSSELGRPPLDPRSSDEPVRLRHMSVIFSCVSDPASVDYVVTDEGVFSEGSAYPSVWQ